MPADQSRSKDRKVALRAVEPAAATTQVIRRRRFRVVPYLITLVTVSFAAVLGWAMWNAYMVTPWTRDASISAFSSLSCAP